MKKYFVITILLSSFIAVPATAWEYKTRFKEYADSCYAVPKDKLRIIVAPVAISNSANMNSGEDTKIRPFSQLLRAPGSRYTIMQLQPAHLIHRVEQGVLVGINADFKVNLVSTQTSILTSYEPPVEYTYDFKTLGYFDIDPAKLPLKFDIQINAEIGTQTVSKENDYTNTIQGYKGGQCFIKGLYIYLTE